MTDPAPPPVTAVLLGSEGQPIATTPVGPDGTATFTVPAGSTVRGYRLLGRHGLTLFVSEPRAERYGQAGTYTVRTAPELLDRVGPAPLIDTEAVEVLVLHERLDRLHVAAPPDRNLLQVVRDLYAAGVRALECSCTPYPTGTGPEEDCPLHGRRPDEWADLAAGLSSALAEQREELRAARAAGTTWAGEHALRVEERDAALAEVFRLRRQLDEVHG